MPQPYSVGLADSKGRPLISVCAGAAHTLASTALLCRQQSLDEPPTRVVEKVTTGPMLRGLSIQRQASVELSPKRDDKSQRLQKKTVKSNMISMYGALLACEQCDAEALSLVLDKNQIDVNSFISTGFYQNYPIKWSLLDVAINLNSCICVSILQKYGAVENSNMDCYEKRLNAINDGIIRSKEQLQTLKQASHSKEIEKQIKNLIAHSEILQKMKETVEKAEVVMPLASATVETSSSSSIAIHVVHSNLLNEIILKYKVEWSVYEDFSQIFGSEVIDWDESHYLDIDNLDEGLKLVFRVSPIGIKGPGMPVCCSPGFVELTSWQDLSPKKERWCERIFEINDLAAAVEAHRDGEEWKRLFPSVDAQTKKKKMGLKELFSASSKFCRNAVRGVFLASLVYTEGKVLCTVDDCLPIIAIDENITMVSKDDHHWLMNMSFCWEQAAALMDANAKSYVNNNSISFRTKLMSAAVGMQNALGLKEIGHLHYLPICYENAVFLLTVRFLESNQQVQGLTLRWLTFNKLLRKRMPTPAIDKLTKETVNILNFFESSQIPLKRGLFLCYLKLHSSINSARVVVPDNLPAILPFVHIRDNPHITKEEWSWVKSADLNEEVEPTKAQAIFYTDLTNAITTLLNDLDIDNDLVPGHRLYHADIIQPCDDVSVILIIPRSNDVCTAPTESSKNMEFFEQRRGCSSIPIPVFEMIHFSTYQPQFITTYCKLSIFLEHFTMISQYEQRKCLNEDDLKLYKIQTEALQDFQKQLDEIWSRARWISRIALEARDKHARVSKKAIPLSRLLAPLSEKDLSNEMLEEELAHLQPSGSKQRPRSLFKSPQESYRDIDRRKISLDVPKDKSVVPDRPIIREDKFSRVSIRVGVAFDCSMPLGSSVRLSVVANTTAEEIVNLVLEQVAKATAGDEEIHLFDSRDYCLVSVMGQRERRLKNEVTLMSLRTSQWTGSNLLVRMRDNFLAGVEFGNESFV